MKRWIVLGRDQRRKKLQSHVHDGISQMENATDPFFPSRACRIFWRTFQSFVYLFYTSFGGESPRLRLLGIALKLRPKIEASQGGLVSVLVHVYM